MCTMLGMALGGWMSGKIFDLTGSYRAAFVNGIAWNLVNLAIVMILLNRTKRIPPDQRGLRTRASPISCRWARRWCC